MTTERRPYDAICVGCDKRPSELDEYIDAARYSNMTPEQYVWAEEGTLNVRNGHFLCTACYIEAGMPVGQNGRRWVAP